MKRFAFILTVLFVTTVTVYTQATKRTPKHETWYEQALRHINPANIDFGSIWEQRKRGLLNEVGSRYFQYSFAATVATIVLLTLLCIQRVSHKRSLDIAVQSIADVLRHDEYSRRIAREAIRRYNKHIDTCNRVIEAEESGASRWVSSAELENLQSELEQHRGNVAALREETKRLREECERHKNTVAELSVRSGSDSQPALPFANETRVAELVTRLNEMQDELIAERKKNQRIKANSPK